METIDKIPIFDWFYELGDVYLTVLTKGSDLLKVPPQFREKDMETFVVGPLSTPSLSYNDGGVNAPMRFGDNFFKCFFPWDRIIMLAGQKAVIQFVMEEKEESDNDSQKIDKKKRGESQTPKEKSAKRSYLQVVK